MSNGWQTAEGFPFTSSLSLTRRPDAGGAEETLYNVSLPRPTFPDSANSRPVDLDGVLEPGYVYRLAATAAASTNTPLALGDAATAGHTTADVTFTLTAVPEPSAVGVLAIAAAVTLRRRRA